MAQRSGMGARADTEDGVRKAESTMLALPRTVDRESPDVTEMARRGFQVAIGLAIVVVESVARSIADSIAHEGTDAPEPVDEDEEPAPQPLVPILAGAMFGVAIETVRTGIRWTSEIGRGVAALMSFAPWAPLVRTQLGLARTRATVFDSRWRDERSQDERLGSELLAALVPRAMDAVIDRIDLTGLVLSRIDVNRIVSAVDVEAILRRLDLAGIARDVIDQLDLPTIARGVIDEIDLREIVRESTGTMADEAMEGIRGQGANADLAVSRFVDRLLGRDGDRRQESRVD